MFSSLKELMISSPLLMPFNLEKKTRISTDASSYALGTAVLQKSDDNWLLVAYASQILKLSGETMLLLKISHLLSSRKIPFLCGWSQL